jgi:hypothetical protein
MDRLIRLFHDSKVKGNGELESMNEKLEFFSTPPSFDALLSQYRVKVGRPLSLRDRFDCMKKRAHYVLMDLSCEKEWKNYKEVMKSSSVKSLEVVEKGSSSFVVRVDDNIYVELVENLTQDEALQSVIVREVDTFVNHDALNDDFIPAHLAQQGLSH